MIILSVEKERDRVEILIIVTIEKERDREKMFNYYYQREIGSLNVVKTAILALKGGYTRFEVEHMSCNLLLYIEKHSKIWKKKTLNISQPSKYPKIAAKMRTSALKVP